MNYGLICKKHQLKLTRNISTRMTQNYDTRTNDAAVHIARVLIFPACLVKKRIWQSTTVSNISYVLIDFNQDDAFTRFL